MTITIVHGERICPDCAGKPGVQLYHFPFNDGHNVSIAHGCLHYIFGTDPASLPSDLWLAKNLVWHGSCDSAPWPNTPDDWREHVDLPDVDPTGFVRIVVETSDDGGEPYNRDVIARGDDAIAVIDELRFARAGF